MNSNEWLLLRVIVTRNKCFQDPTTEQIVRTSAVQELEHLVNTFAELECTHTTAQLIPSTQVATLTVEQKNTTFIQWKECELVQDKLKHEVIVPSTSLILLVANVGGTRCF